jgi:tetratricopeptide (TPR) repeat protein
MQRKRFLEDEREDRKRRRVNVTDQEVMDMTITATKYRVRKDYDRALKYIKKALNMRPYDGKVCIEAALLFEDIQRPIYKYRLHNILLNICSNKYWRYIAKGMLLEEKKRYKEAIEKYHKALKCPDGTDDYFTATFNIGYCHMDLDDSISEAISWFEKAYELQARLPNAQPMLLALCKNNIGSCYSMTCYQTAHDYFSDAIQLYPDYVLFYQNRYDMRVLLGDVHGAESDTEHVLKLTQDRPTLSDAELSKAIICDSDEKQIDHARSALQIWPQNIAAIRFLFDSAVLRGNADIARNVIDEGMQHCTCEDDINQLVLMKYEMENDSPTAERYFFSYSSNAITRIS